MFEKYVKVYVVSSAFLNKSNFLMFLKNNEEEIVGKKRRLKVAPETYDFIMKMVRHGEISKMASQMAYDDRYFLPRTDKSPFLLRHCLHEDIRRGKVLVIIGENDNPDLYTNIIDSIDVAEIDNNGNLCFVHRNDISHREQLGENIEESTDECPEVIMLDRKTFEEIRSSLIQLKSTLESIINDVSNL